MRFMLFAVGDEAAGIADATGWPIATSDMLADLAKSAKSFICLPYVANVGLRVPDDTVVLATSAFIRRHNGPTLMQAIARAERRPPPAGPVKIETGR